MITLQFSTGEVTLVIAFALLVVAFLFLIGAIISRAKRSRRSETERYVVDGDQIKVENTEETPDMARPLIGALKNTDWEARSAAALALGQYGDESAIDPLIDILFHDKNEVVRENAALSLKAIAGPKAVEPLAKVAGNYVAGVEKGAEVATVAAEALGEIGSPRVAECLKQLHECLEKGGFVKESKRVSSAVRKISLAYRRGNQKCVVCQLPFKKSDELVRCPSCGNLAHKTHMLEWLHIKGHCPVCNERVSKYELETV